MYNRIILIGNLTKDPELRYTPQGTPVATFRLAVSSRYKASDDAREETLFIDVVVFGKQAESSSKYLSKGRPVLVEGRLQEREWESDGQKRRKMEVIAQNVRFMGSGGSGGAGRKESPAGEPPDEITDTEPF